MKKLLFTIATLFFHSQSYAQMYSGQELAQFALAYERVTDRRAHNIDHLDAQFFLGYVASTFDTNSYKSYCPPPNLKLGQLASITSSFLKNHPEKWSYSGNEVVKQSFEQAFPCPKPRQ